MAPGNGIPERKVPVIGNLSLDSDSSLPLPPPPSDFSCVSFSFCLPRLDGSLAEYWGDYVLGTILGCQLKVEGTLLAVRTAIDPVSIPHLLLDFLAHPTTMTFNRGTESHCSKSANVSRLISRKLVRPR